MGELRREAGELGAALELGRLNVKNGLTIAEGLAGAPRGPKGREAAGSCTWLLWSEQGTASRWVSVPQSGCALVTAPPFE